MIFFIRLIIILAVLLIIIPMSHSEEPLDSAGVRLAFVGDIYLGNWAEGFIQEQGVDYPFAGCCEILQNTDLAVGNLENPITETGAPIVEKQFLLKASPGIEKGLLKANIHAVNLANNHILDYGYDGLQNTINYLDSSSIKHFGAGGNREEALREAVITIHGQRLAFLGFSATFPEEFWANDSTPGTAFPYNEDVRETITRCDCNYDAVIVSYHWGAEKMDTPKDYQVELAHLSIDSGADLIIGHHPHVAQGIEIYKNVPIFYSLGNFAFSSYSESAKVGLLARILLQNGKVTEAEAIPINVYNAECNFQPVPLYGESREKFMRYFENLCQELNYGESIITIDGTVLIR